METSLSRQLQQAWLETQMRKEKGYMSAISATSSSPGSLNSSSEQHTPPSSSSSSDPCADASTTSAPQMPSQNLDEADFRDPVLQFIHDMLMNENLDDRKCMMAECLSFNSTAKGFYEILGTEVPPLPGCSNDSEPLRISEQDFSNFLSMKELSAQSGSHVSDAPQDDGFLSFDAYEHADNLGSIDGEGRLGFSAQNGEKSRADLPAYVTKSLRSVIKEEKFLRVPSQDTSNANGEENQWIDDLFSNIDTADLEQYASADVVSSPQTSNLGHSDSSGSSYLSSQNPFNSGFHAASYEQDSLLKGDSILPGFVFTASPSVGLSRNSTIVQHTSSRVGKNNAMAGANTANPKWSQGSNMFSAMPPSDTTSILPPSSTSQVVSVSSRFKRAASEIDSSVISDRISSSSSSNSGVVTDSMEEEVVSFVRNKDLNAEKYAVILNEGLTAVMNGKCANNSLHVAREGVGKPTLVVTTIADLKGLLISCAQAVASNNIRRANEILQEIRQDASSYGSGLQRLAHYFAEALVARLSGTGDRLYSVFRNNSPSAAKMLKSHSHYVMVCPFVKVSTYVANRAILEAAKGASRVHIIDYGILYGIQWPGLISALAERKGGPPVLRITGIDFPQPGTLRAECVEMTGDRLAEYAKTYGVPFEYKAIASRWETIQPSSLSLRQDEVVIVNCMHRLHNLLDETVLASNPRKTVLSNIREINPKLFVHGIKNGNYNAPFFMSRFKEALASFSGVFDLFETVMKNDSQERMMVERELLGRTILNVVACEGAERIERPETYRQWQNRTVRAGFEAIPLDQIVLKESQTIVRCSYNKNFSIDEDDSWMLLSWKGKVVHAIALWKPASAR